MPYKFEGEEIVFEGNLRNWLADLQAWYLEDVPAKNILPTSYMQLVVTIFAQAAHKEWENTWWGGEARKEGLDALVRIVDGSVEMNVLDVADYLAENLDDSFREKHAAEARQFAREVIAKHHPVENEVTTDSAAELKASKMFTENLLKEILDKNPDLDPANIYEHFSTRLTETLLSALPQDTIPQIMPELQRIHAANDQESLRTLLIKNVPNVNQVLEKFQHDFTAEYSS